MHAQTIAFVAALPEKSPLYVPVIVLGELQFGIECARLRRHARLTEAERCLLESKDIYLVRDVTRHTAELYGKLKASLAAPYLNKNRRPPEYVETWMDEIHGRQFGVTENDLWICAVAAERNLIVVTNDGGFNQVAEYAPTLLRVQTIK